MVPSAYSVCAKSSFKPFQTKQFYINPGGALRIGEHLKGPFSARTGTDWHFFRQTWAQKSLGFAVGPLPLFNYQG